MSESWDDSEEGSSGMEWEVASWAESEQESSATEVEIGQPPWLAISGRFGCYDDDDEDVFPDDRPLRTLEKFMDAWSSDPLFDRRRADALILSDFRITRPFITRLVPLLLHHHGSSSVLHEIDNNHMDHSPGTCTTSSGISALKFHTVRIDNCSFFSSADATMLDQNDNVCTPDDKHSYFSALAQLPCLLEIQADNFTDVISGLLSIPEIDRLRVTNLRLLGEPPLSDLEYMKLGALIHGSEQMTALTLELPFLDDIPQDFFDRLANSVHLQMLCINYNWHLINSDDQREALTSSLMFGEAGNGMVERLVRNPKNQLTSLDLSGRNLDDHRLMALVQLLPTSHIRTLDLSFNRIRPPGLLEFARQLPNMLSLNSMGLRCNPWQEEASEECGEALVQGLLGNTSITWIDFHDFCPQRRLLLHYLALNRAGRKILSSCQKQPISDGLWPLILERGGQHIIRLSQYISDDFEDFDYSGTRKDSQYRYVSLDDGPVNTMFFFLQNCPKLFSYY